MRQGFTLGGPTAWKVRAVGDLVIAYHWVNDEPTMFIYPRYRRLLARKVVPWGMPLPAAHELVHADSKGAGVNSEELLAKATRCAHLIGFGDDRNAIFRIADLILAGLDDLIHMPPTPRQIEEQQSPVKQGDVLQLKKDGEIVFEQEM